MKENIEFCVGRKKTEIEELLKAKKCMMSLRETIILRKKFRPLLTPEEVTAAEKYADKRI